MVFWKLKSVQLGRRPAALLVILAIVASFAWWVAVREILPLGLMFVMVIGAGAAFVAGRRVDASPRPVLRRLLLPLSVMVMLLMVGAGMLLWQQHQYQLAGEISDQIAVVNREFKVDLDNQGKGLAEAAQSIAADASVQKALRSGNADGLLSTWRPMFETLRQEFNLTHLKFMDAGRVCLLRVHNPEFRGDRNDFNVAIEAQRTGKTASGIELGHTGNLRGEGTLSLRVVQPVFEGGKLAGFVEMGKEVEDVLKTRLDRAGLELGIVIDKEHLNRQAWEENMHRLGRKDNWDRLTDNVVIYASQGNLPDAFAPWAQQVAGQTIHGETDREIAFKGQVWRVSTSSLHDASGKDIGDLLIMRDVSAEHAAFARTLILGGVIGGILLALLLAFIYVLLRRTDAGIQVQQAQLRESEERLSATLRSIGDGVITVDAAGNIVSLNTVAETLLGWNSDEAQSRPIAEAFRIVHARTQQAAEIPVDRALREDRVVALADHTVLIARDGTERQIADSCAPIHNAAGAVIGAVLVFRDVTEECRQREQLRESERRYHDLFESSRDAIMTLDPPTWKFSSCNPATVALFGVESEAAFVDLGPWQVSPATQPDGRDSGEKAKAMIETAMREGSHVFEWTHQRLDGKEFPATVVLTRMEQNGKAILQACVRDITERKQAEEALRTSGLKLAQAMELAQLANWEYEVATDQFTFDDHFYAIYGTTVDREGGSRMSSAVYAREFVHPDEIHLVAEEIGKALSTTEVRYEREVEHRIVRRDGEIRHIIVHFAIRRDSTGQIVGFHGANQDITERKQAEEMLRIERENLKAIFASSPVGMLLLDEDTMIVDANSVLAGMVSGNLDQILHHRGGGGLGCVHSLENEKGCGFALACPDCKLRNGITQVLVGGKSIRGAEIQPILVNGDQQLRPWLSVSAEPVLLNGRKHVVVAIEDITARKQAEEELRVSNAQLSRLNEELQSTAAQVKNLMAEMVARNDFTGRFANTALTPCWEAKKCKQTTCPSYGNHQTLRCWEVAGTFCGGQAQGEFAQKCGDCSRCEIYQRARSNPVMDLGETFNTMASILQDRHQQLKDRSETLQTINAELEAQQMMIVAQTRDMRALLDGMPGHSFLKGRNGEYLAANQMFCQALGKKEEEIIGATDADLFPPELAHKRLADDEQIFSAQVPMLETEEMIARGSGQEWMLTRKIPVHAADGSVERLIGVSIDITSRKVMEEELRTAARTDKLTGLPNRALLGDRLQQAVLRSRRIRDYHFAILFLDFDRFKAINDSLGHDVGDLLLQEIARRLQATVRSGDSLNWEARQHTTARLGGDEFVVLLDGIANPQDATTVADRLLEIFARPYQLGAHTVYSTASIGIVTSDMADENAADVLRDADTAMYEAKSAGKGQYVVFDVSMRQRVQNHLSLENDLRKALDAGELFLMYQPIVSLLTGEVDGFEALVRWQHPQRGLVSPGEFIPIAEDAGLIAPIGEWVLREACRQFTQWRDSMGDAAPHSISVNLSRRQLALPDLSQTVRRIVEETGMDPGCLHLEVTESAVMKNTAVAMQTLHALKAIGVKLAMDDFGTGYSSLACLHQFPLDVLKIDRSFIANIDRGRDFAALVYAVAQLARNLNISVVAEGIETADQLLTLQSLECEFGQGYLFSKPLIADQVADFRVRAGVLPGLAA